jgi:hypothetical protein
MHDYHDGLPGYSPEQILHDGCGECEARSKTDDHGLANLDRVNFYRAWGRAARWNREGLTDLSRAEIPLLNLLWVIQLKLESYAQVPIGVVPAQWPV